MRRIAIFASGTGSNARRIIEHLEDNQTIEVSIIISNKATAKVLDMGLQYSINTLVVDRSSFYDTQSVLLALQDNKVDWIVLAGFLWLIPIYILQAFPDRIVNIHPALLPLYGGKGMYGSNVHKAVKTAGDTVSGMTIHLVNEKYDEGAIVFQGRVDIFSTDSADDIAAKVLKLEHEYYPTVIEGLVMSQL